MDNDIIAFLQSIQLFSGLSPSELTYIANHLQVIRLLPGEYIIHEHELAEKIYFVKAGQVEVGHYDAYEKQFYSFSVLDKGSVVGEVALIDQATRSASVRAIVPTVLYALNISDLKEPAQNWMAKMKRFFQPSAETVPANLFNRVTLNASKYVTKRIRDTNETVIAGLKNELAQTRARNALSRLIINTFILLCLFIFIYRSLSELDVVAKSTTFVSVVFMITFSIPLLHMIKQSGYPLSTYGFTLKNWQHNVIEAVIYTIPWLLLILFYKFLLVHYAPRFFNHSIFEFTVTLHTHTGPVSSGFWYGLLITGLYLLFVPLQAVLANGVLQSSFQLLLVGPYRVFWAIILSNLIFSCVHTAISLKFGLLVFLPGVFWGWLYAKQHSLIGIIVSHWLIGIWALFVLNILG